MNKSTPAQRSYIASLANQVTKDQFRDCFEKAAAQNGNIYKPSETATQAAGRLTKQAASTLIEQLKQVTA